MIGKTAVAVVRDFFDKPEYQTRQARAQFVQDQLNNVRYIYQDPNAMVCLLLLPSCHSHSDVWLKTGAYRSDFVMRTHAYHESLVAALDVFYDNPVGALAFAATAVSPQS